MLHREKDLPVAKTIELENALRTRFRDGVPETFCGNEAYNEREIRYLKDAYDMPYDEIAEALRAYYATYPRDELRFVDGLRRRYRKPQDVILRRIREVKRIGGESGDDFGRRRIAKRGG